MSKRYKNCQREGGKSCLTCPLGNNKLDCHGNPANNLKYCRQVAGVSQSELSRISGISVKSLQNYEQGRLDINKVQGMTLYKLASALDVKIEDLLEL